jgi:hypothetical protein
MLAQVSIIRDFEKGTLRLILASLSTMAVIVLCGCETVTHSAALAPPPPHKDIIFAARSDAAEQFANIETAAGYAGDVDVEIPRVQTSAKACRPQQEAGNDALALQWGEEYGNRVGVGVNRFVDGPRLQYTMKFDAPRRNNRENCRYVAMWSGILDEPEYQAFRWPDSP